MAARILSAVDQGWPLARPFAISRGVKTEARVVVAEVAEADGPAGRGECVPYARYGETVDSVIHQIAEVADAIAGAGIFQATLASNSCRDAHRPRTRRTVSG